MLDNGSVKETNMKTRERADADREISRWEWLNEMPTTRWHEDGELCYYTNDMAPEKKRLLVLNAGMVAGTNLEVNDKPLQWVMYKVKYEGEEEAEETLMNLGNVWHGIPMEKEIDCRVEKCMAEG